MTITLRSVKGSELSHAELDANFSELDLRSKPGWKDLVAPISGAPGGGVAPALVNFQSAGTLQRKEYAFSVDDYVYIAPFHIGHDIMPGGLAYLHVHWAASGTNANSVKWEFHIQRALGHNQAIFPAPTVLSVVQASSGIAYRHMIAEVALAQALTFTEPDELMLVTLRRVTNGATDNTDSIFGLMVDIHYQADRDTTPNKAPNFYA